MSVARLQVRSVVEVPSSGYDYTRYVRSTYMPLDSCVHQVCMYIHMYHQTRRVFGVEANEPLGNCQMRKMLTIQTTAD